MNKADNISKASGRSRKMVYRLRDDALDIVKGAINAVLPNEGVVRGLKGKNFPGRLYVVAVGKAAWKMARSVVSIPYLKVESGIVLTKYGHSEGPIEGFEIIEAGHPLPDRNSVEGTTKIIKMTEGLEKKDTVLFLLSGGGSSLFEKPLPGISLDDITIITEQLLSCGADIVEINTVRKRLSSVKAGRFARLVEPASVFSIVLSDVIGDRLDFIASGPAYPDNSTSVEAFSILEKYKINVSRNIKEILEIETPKTLHNSETIVTGSVRSLCEEASIIASSKGYYTNILTTVLGCEAREAGSFIASIAREEMEMNRPLQRPCAIILGGETVVHLKGNGKGGRNQETALAAAKGISNLEGVVIASVGSDGTDGPTDAAGGIIDGGTVSRMRAAGIDLDRSLDNNDSYNALAASGDLLKTGPTGTNVNDLVLILCDGRE